MSGKKFEILVQPMKLRVGWLAKHGPVRGRLVISKQCLIRDACRRH